MMQLLLLVPEARLPELQEDIEKIIDDMVEIEAPPPGHGRSMN